MTHLIAGTGNLYDLRYLFKIVAICEFETVVIVVRRVRFVRVEFELNVKILIAFLFLLHS